MKKTINKKQLYKFLKKIDACPEGLNRLRHHLKTKTARETIDSYRTCKFLWTPTSYIRGCDYNWLCHNIGLEYYLLPTTDTIIKRIIELDKPVRKAK
jgi:hypothetical protein